MKKVRAIFILKNSDDFGNMLSYLNELNFDCKSVPT